MEEFRTELSEAFGRPRPSVRVTGRLLSGPNGVDGVTVGVEVGVSVPSESDG
jgi:hypothetical protein